MFLLLQVCAKQDDTDVWQVYLSKFYYNFHRILVERKTP